MLTVKDIPGLRDIPMVSYILAVDIPAKVKYLERMVTVDGGQGMTLTFDRTWVPAPRCSSMLEHKSLILVPVLYISLSLLGRVKG